MYVNVNPWHRQGHIDSENIAYAEFIVIDEVLNWVNVMTKDGIYVQSELRDHQDIDGLRQQLERAGVPFIINDVCKPKEDRLKFFPYDVQSVYEAHQAECRADAEARHAAYLARKAREA